MRYLFRSTIVLLAGCFASGCGANEVLLKKRVEAYFDCDEERNYECMWSMRTPVFRGNVPLEVYKRESLEYYENWQTVEWKILGTKLHDEKLAEVVYEIKEKIPMGLYLAGQDAGGKTARFVETMEWWKINGEWYALDVGFRGRLAFAGGLEQSRVARE